MSRLTNDIRDAIRSNLMRHRFKIQVTALRERSAVLADAIYNTAYPEKDRKLMSMLPEGWLDTGGHMYFSTSSGHKHQFCFNGCYSGIQGVHYGTSDAAENRPFAYKWRDSYHNCYALKDEALNQQVEEFIQDVSKHNSAYKLAETQIEASLAAFSSIKKLIEAWPEVEPFAEAYIDRPVAASLPAKTVASLNAMLGLPV